jgi:preprotein translocase subunit SecB
MKATVSPLSIIDFAVTSMDFKMKPPAKAETDIQEMFGGYEIDIDFSIVKSDIIMVSISAKINTEKGLPGYSIAAEAGCFFRFDESSNLSETDRASLESFSTVYIALNSLRGLISSFTANAPFGRYILPSVDLNALIKQKVAQQNDNKKDKTNDKQIKKEAVKKSRKKVKESP